MYIWDDDGNGDSADNEEAERVGIAVAVGIFSGMDTCNGGVCRRIYRRIYRSDVQGRRGVG